MVAHSPTVLIYADCKDFDCIIYLTRALLNLFLLSQEEEYDVPEELEDIIGWFTLFEKKMLMLAILFFFGCLEGNSTWLITSELASQRARKVLFTCVVYANTIYDQLVMSVIIKIFDNISPENQ